MNWRDEILLREFDRFQAVEPVAKGMGPRAPLPEPEHDSYPDAMFSHLANSYARLNNECAETHREAKRAQEAYSVMAREAEHRSEAWKAATREAKRNRRAFVMATWTAAFLLLVAILEGAALWGMWPR